jgi:serine/threonine protein kinase
MEPIMEHCPSSDALVAFHTGELVPAELGDIARHIEHCSRCEERLQFLDGVTDPVLAALRRGGGESDRPAPPVSPSPSFLREASSGAIRLDSANASISYAFLDTAEGPGELGRLGHYRVLSLLGRGGMGMVFHAEDLHLRRPVALKVLSPNLGGGLEPRQRFLREARATAALRNDHIVTIYQVGQVNDVPYLAMELLRGEPLDAWLSRGAQPTLGETVRIGREIAEGLAAAHDAGLIHRDIKPANIWLEDRSSVRGTAAPRVKILDFGLAQIVSDDVRLTKTGYIVGTPAYMAPEQARNEGVDARADLFSLGCVLYRLATGRQAFPGETTMAVLIALAVDRPPDMHTLNPQLPPPFCKLVEWLLAKNPADRPVSAHVVVDALSVIEQETSAVALTATAAPGTDHGEAEGTQALSVETPPQTPLMQRAVPTRVAIPSAKVKPTGWGMRWNLRQILLVTSLLGLLALIVVGLMIPTRIGVLVVQGEDDVLARLDQQLVRVRDRRTGTETVLSSPAKGLPLGEYDVEIDPAAGLTAEPSTITIEAGRKTVVQVTPRAKPAVADPDRGLRAWIEETAALKGAMQAKTVEEKLRERNPKFKGPFEPRFEGDAIVEVRIDTKSITDLSPLRALKKLSILQAWSSDPAAPDRLADLAPLAGMAISELSLKNTRVVDLTPLADLSQLTKLDLERASVTDLRPLQRCRKLETLGVGGTGIKTLAGLEGLPLKLLSMERTDVSDLTPLKEVSLNHLDCSFTPVASLAPLEGKPLAYLAAFDSKVKDLSPLKGMPLMYLSASVDTLKQNAAVIRMIRSLTSINNLPVDKFWEANKP